MSWGTLQSQKKTEGWSPFLLYLINHEDQLILTRLSCSLHLHCHYNHYRPLSFLAQSAAKLFSFLFACHFFLHPILEIAAGAIFLNYKSEDVILFLKFFKLFPICPQGNTFLRWLTWPLIKLSCSFFQTHPLSTLLSPCM